jgi:hypothetical protein
VDGALVLARVRRSTRPILDVAKLLDVQPSLRIELAFTRMGDSRFSHPNG